MTKKIHVNTCYAVHPELRKFIDGNQDFRLIDTTRDPDNGLLNEWTSLKKIYDEDEDLDYVGLNHYRRLFDPADLADFRKFDIVCARPIPMAFRVRGEIKTGTIEDGFKLCHIPSVWDAMENLIPDKTVLNDWKNRNELNSPCCCFLARRELFRKMFEFAWPILTELKKTIDLSGVDNYQKRQLAFVGERLFSFFVFRERSVGSAVKEIKLVFRPDWKPADAKDKRGTYSK